MDLKTRITRYGSRLTGSNSEAIAQLAQKIEQATPENPLLIYKSLKPFYRMIALPEIQERKIIFEPNHKGDPYNLFEQKEILDFGIKNLPSGENHG